MRVSEATPWILSTQHWGWKSPSHSGVYFDKWTNTLELIFAGSQVKILSSKFNYFFFNWLNYRDESEVIIKKETQFYSIHLLPVFPIPWEDEFLCLF